MPNQGTSASGLSNRNSCFLGDGMLDPRQLALQLLAISLVDLRVHGTSADNETRSKDIAGRTRWYELALSSRCAGPL